MMASHAQAALLSNALPSPAPATSPPVSPSAATAKEPHDEEQQYRTDGCIDDGAYQSRAEMDAELRQQPTSDKSAQNAHDEIADEPETGASDDLSRQPACDETDKQHHQQALARFVHVVTFSFAVHARPCRPIRFGNPVDLN